MMARGILLFKSYGEATLAPLPFPSSPSRPRHRCSLLSLFHFQSNLVACMVRHKITYYKMLTLEHRAEIQVEMRVAEEARRAAELAAVEEEERVPEEEVPNEEVPEEEASVRRRMLPWRRNR